MGVIDIDLVLTPSEEAKICLYCDKQKCNPNCTRRKEKMQEIKNREKAEENAVKIKEEFEFLAEKPFFLK